MLPVLMSPHECAHIEPRKRDNTQRQNQDFTQKADGHIQGNEDAPRFSCPPVCPQDLLVFERLISLAGRWVLLFHHDLRGPFCDVAGDYRALVLVSAQAFEFLVVLSDPHIE